MSAPNPGADGGPVEQDGPFLARGESASGPETVQRVTAPETGGQAVTGETVASSSWAAVKALAALLEPEAFDPDQPADEAWREVTQQRALGHAAKVLTSTDYRRVVEDDDTIAQVADAIDEDVRRRWTGRPDEFLSSPNDWREVARAVVRALRGDTNG